MKHCSKCNKQYDDSWSVCLADKSILVQDQPDAPKPKDRIIKKPETILIAQIVNWIAVIFIMPLMLLIIFPIIVVLLRGDFSAQFVSRAAVPIISSVLLLITVLFLVKLNKGLSQLRPSARMWQLVISFIGLFAFPIGTLFYGVVFFTFLFHKKTKEAFEGTKTKEID